MRRIKCSTDRGGLNITVYSIWHPDVEQHPACKSKVNHYHYIKMNSVWAKLKKRFFNKTHHEGYYHYTIEYFLHEALRHIRQQDYDIIILENRPGYALKLKEATNARLVYHLHNEKLTSTVPQCRAIYEAADEIITVSDYIKSCVLTINTDDTKTTSVYNGIPEEVTQENAILLSTDKYFVKNLASAITLISVKP